MRVALSSLLAVCLGLFTASCIEIDPGFEGCTVGGEDCPCTRGGGCDLGLICAPDDVCREPMSDDGGTSDVDSETGEIDDGDDDDDTSGFSCDACPQGTLCDAVEDVCVEARTIVYLNLGPEGMFEYSATETSAKANRHWVDPSLVGQLPGYGPETQLLFDRVRNHFAPFRPRADLPEPNGILITPERPDAMMFDYDMVAVTSAKPLGNLIGGGDGTDCANGTLDNIFIVMVGADDGLGDLLHANAVSSSIAHLLGLDFVDAEGMDLMNRFTENIQVGFADECLPESLTVPANCSAVHEIHCAPGFQNSFAELLDVAGQ